MFLIIRVPCPIPSLDIRPSVLHKYSHSPLPLQLFLMPSCQLFRLHLHLCPSTPLPDSALAPARRQSRSKKTQGTSKNGQKRKSRSSFWTGTDSRRTEAKVEGPTRSGEGLRAPSSSRNSGSEAEGFRCAANAACGIPRPVVLQSMEWHRPLWGLGSFSLSDPYESKLSTGQPSKKHRSYAAMPFLFAEAEGFEPPERCRSTVFKTAAIDHSATPPICRAREGPESKTRSRP